MFGGACGRLWDMKSWLGIFFVVLVVVGGFFVWDNFFAYDAGDVEREYVEAMKRDVYGGATPQETLDLFVAALRAGDTGLASKYFMLDDGLSRDTWLRTLEEIDGQGLLNEMADDIEGKTLPDLEGRIDENDYKFGIYNDDGILGALIDMQYNKYTGVWKIESL
jgi:hypothetical protein